MSPSDIFESWTLPWPLLTTGTRTLCTGTSNLFLVLRTAPVTRKAGRPGWGCSPDPSPVQDGRGRGAGPSEVTSALRLRSVLPLRSTGKTPSNHRDSSQTSLPSTASRILDPTSNRHLPPPGTSPTGVLLSGSSYPTHFSSARTKTKSVRKRFSSPHLSPALSPLSP